MNKRKKIVVFFYMILFILNSIIIVNQSIASELYDLTFETTPGGCTVHVNGVGTKISSPIDGSCTFHNLEEGNYHYTVSKSGYQPQSDIIQLTSDSKVIVILNPDYSGADLDATIFFTPGPVPPNQLVVVGSITVYNVGSSDSKLDWAITEWPDFGSNWVFDPLEGTDLTPEYGGLLVSIAYRRPTLPGRYSGRFVVQNIHDPSDYEILRYTLWVGIDGISYQDCKVQQGSKLFMIT